MLPSRFPAQMTLGSHCFESLKVPVKEGGKANLTWSYIGALGAKWIKKLVKQNNTLLRVIPTMACRVRVVRWGLLPAFENHSSLEIKPYKSLDFVNLHKQTGSTKTWQVFLVAPSSNRWGPDKTLRHSQWKHQTKCSDIVSVMMFKHCHKIKKMFSTLSIVKWTSETMFRHCHKNIIQKWSDTVSESIRKMFRHCQWNNHFTWFSMNML